MNSQISAADVADELGRRIVTGHYEPGIAMPSVRGLAEEFGISKATAQVALSRLEAARFVVAERGRGFFVQDVRRRGGFDVYGAVFRLSMADPELAVSTFTDIVNLGRTLLLDILGDYFQSPVRSASPRLAEIVDAMEFSAQQPDLNLAEFLEAEFGLLREIAVATGQSATVALLNSVADLILGVPQAVDAYYAADPSAHVLIWRAIVNALNRPEPPHEAEYALVGDMLTLYHHRVIERFTTHIAPNPHHAPVAAETA